MNVHALDIPESTADLAGWLESHLVGLHLGTLVAELMAVHGGVPHRPLEEILGDDLPHAIYNGLQGVSRERLTALLRCPTALLELQERIVIDGGPYWEARAQSHPELQQEVSAGWKRLQAAITKPRSLAAASEVRKGPPAWKAVLLATAALVLVTIGVSQIQWGGGPAGGLAQTSGQHWPSMPQDQPPRQYLDTLASSARSWNQNTPATRDGLEKGLVDFRNGCDELLASSHPQLAPADRDWLKERCRAWRGKVVAHLEELEKTGNVEKVRKDVDETIQKLVKALTERKVA